MISKDSSIDRINFSGHTLDDGTLKDLRLVLVSSFEDSQFLASDFQLRNRPFLRPEKLFGFGLSSIRPKSAGNLATILPKPSRIFKACRPIDRSIDRSDKPTW
jgi:hypothetical protein